MSTRTWGSLVALLFLAMSQAPAQQVVGVAKGAFEVEIKMLDASPGADASTVQRMSLSKTLSGDLVGTSRGEMIATGSPASGSGVYVAIERITGTLAGRTGSFSVHHTGVMNRGAQQLTITVVPESGTDGLAGIAGTMQIIIDGKKHFYTFDYTLPR
jgi:enoyl-[acyl-carrier-protein] reductase (NADH)